MHRGTPMVWITAAGQSGCLDVTPRDLAEFRRAGGSGPDFFCVFDVASYDLLTEPLKFYYIVSKTNALMNLVDYNCFKNIKCFNELLSGNSALKKTPVLT